MSSRTLPAIKWGTAHDISAAPWTDTGTGTATGGNLDPFGGSAGYLLDDTSAANQYARRLPLTLLSAGTQWAVVCVEQGTSSTFAIQFFETTGSTVRAAWDGTWAAGLPSLVLGAGSGSAYGPVSLGNNWFAFLVSGNGVVVANTPMLYLHATQRSNASVGSTVFYVANVVLLDLLGSPLVFRRPRDGYEALVAPSGVEDAASYGDEYPLIARTSWVPTTARSFPQIVSGWDGQNESVGVNCSVSAMLSAGWNKNTLRFAPDRSACTTYVDGYLRRPGKDWRPELEGNADRAFEMELVSLSPLLGF